MSTVTPTMTELPVSGPWEAFRAVWANMANGDVGLPVELYGYNDRSVQVEGTFGTGGSARIEGSLDGSTYRALRDPTGTALDVTTAVVKGVLEAVTRVRPSITAGDGTTSLTVTMLFVRTRK